MPCAPSSGPRCDLTHRLLGHHLDHTRELLENANALPAEALCRSVRPGFVVVWFEGEETTAALMAERLVATLEVWVAAISGQPQPDRRDGAGQLLSRFDVVVPRISRLVHGIRERGAWNDAFVDALCEPPQAFTYGGVLAHVIEYGAIRRHALAGVLRELGADLALSDDPIEWER